MEPHHLAPPPRHLPQEVEGGERERRQKMLTPLTPDLQPNEEENRQLIVIFLVYLHLHCRQIFSFFQYVSMCKTIVSYLPQNRTRVCNPRWALMRLLLYACAEAKYALAPRAPAAHKAAPQLFYFCSAVCAACKGSLLPSDYYNRSRAMAGK